MSLARSLAGRVRRGLLRGANDVLDRLEAWAGEPSSRPVDRRSPFADAPARVSPFASSAAAPAAVATPAVSAPVEPMAATNGPQLSFDEVQAVLEDMVRPALQSDGGDITLLRVENNDVFVQLQGACTTCSSSVVTMRHGVERLLREEFPHFGELHEVPGPA